MKKEETTETPFPVEPLAINVFGRVVIEKIEMAEMKTPSGIAIMSKPGDKRSYPLGRILALTESLKEHIKVNDKVFFSDLGGSWQRVNVNGTHKEVGVITQMDIIARYRGQEGDVFQSEQPVDKHKKNNIEDVGTVSRKPAEN